MDSKGLRKDNGKQNWNFSWFRNLGSGLKRLAVLGTKGDLTQFSVSLMGG